MAYSCPDELHGGETRHSIPSSLAKDERHHEEDP